MLNYYLSHLSFGIFKRLTNIAKITGLIYYNDFHIFPIDEKVSVSSLPREDYKPIVQNFDVVIGFLDPSEYGSREVEWINKTKTKYYNIPVTDYTAPNIDDYLKLFKILENHKNSKILIHCYAGKGRSNCGVAAYLMHKHKISSDKAIQIVEMKNPRSSMNRWQKQSLHALNNYNKI